MRDTGHREARHERVPVWLKAVAGGLIGAAAGFAVYRFVGCSTGSCPITSNWLLSVFYGTGVGVLVGISV